MKILLVDDHGIVRQGLQAMLEKHNDIEVVGQAEDGQKALSLVQKLKPDIVIMDVTMPVLNGSEATRQIVERFPDVKVIALSIHSEQRFVANMLKAGASGYIVKECLFDEFIQAVRTVDEGSIYLSPDVEEVVVDDYVKRVVKGPEGRSLPLKSREKKVLKLLAEGRTTKQIASEMHVSPKTIESDRRQIMEKLDIHSIAELTKFALREGLTSV